MKRIALAATLIFSTAAAFNNTGNYWAKVFATDKAEIKTAGYNTSDELIPMRAGRADLAQADGSQR